MRTLTDLQRPAADDAPAAALSLDVQATRTFDTPAFRGITFHEVLARSALNRVKGMPFGWSINPYRGCSHACTYCLSGDTPVLMSDCRSAAIKDLRPGDRVYGTVLCGGRRRVVQTVVRDHWETTRRAWRVTLQDGTEVVASADHRFLTTRGWTHLTGARTGPDRRPHLTATSVLRGFGSLGREPQQNEEYQRGYLCGTIRGHEQAVRRHDTVDRSLLTFVDHEALARTQRFLDACGIATRRRPVHDVAVDGRSLTALHAQGPGQAAAIEPLTALPRQHGGEWTRGFVSGLLDAVGSRRGGVLQMHVSDRAVVERLAASLTQLAVRHVVEADGANGCTVRVLEGVASQLRLLHAVAPAVTRAPAFEGVALEHPAAEPAAAEPATAESGAPLAVVGIDDLGVDIPMYDISTGTGDFFANGVVSHNCFARPTHRYLNLSPGADFEREIVVKTNVVEVLRHELRRPSWARDHVAMGTNTDPYQRAEGRYRLMPGIVAALADARTPFSILTKGTLITRDVPDLVAASARSSVSAALTVGMLDRDLWRLSEPGTPSPAARLAAVRRLNDAGIPAGVMLAPIMPGLNDDPAALTALVDAAAEAGAVHISPIVLHTRGEVRGLVREWLARERPDVLRLHERLYARSGTVDRSYADEVAAHVARARAAAWRRVGRPSPPSGWRGEGDDLRPPVAAGTGAGRTPEASLQVEQLSLL